MDPLPALPVPAGESPFHIKGIAVQRFREFCAKKVPGGVRTVAERLSDAGIRTFFEQPFLDASWYDFLPFLHIMGAGAAVMGIPTSQFVHEQSSWQLDHDVRTVHRVLLMAASPEAVAPRLGAGVARYFDFFDAKTVSVNKGEVIMSVSGLPALLLPWYKVSVQAGADTVLEIAGAKNLQAGYTAPEPDGSKAGIPLVRFQVRRSWT
jgi:hypothetical protein